MAAAAIEVTGLPTGAVLEKVYLYWVTYGEKGSSTLKLDGGPIAGTAIGSSSGTCWNDRPTFENFTYRADVTDRVTGNGTYELSAFPSGTAKADTQGASLFVVYSDPMDKASGTVLLYDGALTSSDQESCSGTFADVRPPAVTLSADLFFSVGDGQLVIPDGPLRFDTTQLPAFGEQHWDSSSGMYWDVRRYDVTPLLNADDDSVNWTSTFGGDCLVFAYSALAFRSELDDACEDEQPECGSSGGAAAGGAGDSAGGASAASGGEPNLGGAGEMSAGGSNSSGGGTVDGSDGEKEAGSGGNGAEAGDDASSEGGQADAGSAFSGDEAGCGCRLAPSDSSRLTSLGVLAFLASLRRKRRRALLR